MRLTSRQTDSRPGVSDETSAVREGAPVPRVDTARRTAPRRCPREASRASPTAGTLGAVRLTAFWERMNQQFGEGYAESVAKDFVIADLGGRTAVQALDAGVDTRAVWRAVCATFDVPDRLR